jgi:hypothetical protein
VVAIEPINTVLVIVLSQATGLCLQANSHDAAQERQHDDHQAKRCQASEQHDDDEQRHQSSRASKLPVPDLSGRQWDEMIGATARSTRSPCFLGRS